MADDAPDLGAVAAAVASNLVAPVGVVALGWSATVLLGVFAVEFAALSAWSLVKMPFAAKRPRSYVERSRIAGLLHRVRGSISLPGPIPPVYPRNLMVIIGGVVFGAVGVVLTLALFGYVASGGVTEQEAGALGLGALSVFVLRGGETYIEYFRRRGYRDHSARSAFYEPLTTLFGVGFLFAAAIAIDATGVVDASRSGEVLALLVVGKIALDVRGLQIEADDDRYGILARMFGGKDVELDPEPIDEPDGEPELRVRPPRAAAVADAGFRVIVYLATNGISLFALAAAVVAGLIGGPSLALAVAAALLLPFAAARALARYLTYGAVEYRCYDGLLVVHSTLLDAGQQRLRRQAVDGVEIDRDLVDRAFDTETLDLDAEEPDETPDFGLPDPDEDPDVDVNTDRPRTLPHVREPGAIVDAMGVRWILEREQ
ncbi:hypothetical protein B4589_003335 [Halolamina sp. CBA1230]|uniref:DUF6498-containing protein n=1 Tax=Halolamina sp. CBA1230 TaxID=1853690 RepID=UPI0009A163A7|nr:DUF6498-containing protein [Halolamina sp. CBA1230]QKY19457.1 hypothetical protein B4589_003335 [Halolamina sp. CBA1230]